MEINSLPNYESFASLISSVSVESQLEVLIISNLKKFSKYDPFDSQHEVKILISYYNDVIDFAKSTLFLSPQKQAIVLSIANTLIIEGTIQKPRSSTEKLANIVLSHTEYFNPSDLSSILGFFTKGYFKHIRLYNYIFSSRENTETTHVQALIDEPLPTMPLSKSVQRVKNRLPLDDPQDTKALQRSRTKLANSRRGNDSKEPPIEAPLDSQASEEPILDPVAEKVTKLQLHIDSELQKRESVIEQEIEELKKRYK